MNIIATASMEPIGNTIGWTVLGWVLIALALLTALFVWLEWADDWSDGLYGIFAGFAGVIAVALAIAWFVTPSENKALYQIEGTVTSVTNSFEEGSGQLTGGAFVFEIDTYDALLYTRSTRLAASVGETLPLVCSRNWKIQAADYWECTIGGELEATP